MQFSKCPARNYVRNRLIAGQPVVEAADAFLHRDARAPARRLRITRSVGDVVALIGGAPIFKLNFDGLALQAFYLMNDLEQTACIARPATDVVGLTRQVMDMALCELHGVDQIVDVHEVAHLIAVAVDHERLAREHSLDEVRDPALIFVAELTRAIDTAHAEYGRGQVVVLRVIQDVLSGAALRTAVGTAEAKRRGLAKSAAAYQRIDGFVAPAVQFELELIEAAVHFIGRGEHAARRLRQAPQLFEHREGSADVDYAVEPRRIEAGRHRALRGEVEHLTHALERGAHDHAIAHVAEHEVEILRVLLRQPVQIFLAAGPREVVEDAHGPALLQQSGRLFPAYYARTARHHARIVAPPRRTAHAAAPRLMQHLAHLLQAAVAEQAGKQLRRTVGAAQA